MGWGQLLGSAVGSLFGPVGTGVGAALGGAVDQDSANQYNSSAASNQMAFQERMANTAYQRQVADMKAAGINPMAAYSSGGASVPVGSSASFSNVVDSSGSSASAVKTADAAGVSAASSAVQAAAQTRQVEANVAKIQQEISNLGTDQERAKATIDLLVEQRQNAIKEGWNLTEVGNQIRATVSKLSAETRNLGPQYLLIEAQRMLAESQSGNQLADTSLKQLDISAAESAGNLGREMGQLKPVIDILMQLIGMRVGSRSRSSTTTTRSGKGWSESTTTHD